MTIELPRKQIPLRSISLSWSDVIRIFERLLRHVNEQADQEIGQFVKPESQTEAQFEAYKEKTRADAFRITVTIRGRDNESLFGDDVELFHSSNLPDVISLIYMTNAVAYKGVAGIKPLNAFELQLDFSKPPLLDSSNLVSRPTQNLSHLTVDGDRDSWVASISDAVMGVIDNRRNKRTWVHRAFVYDFGLLLLGLPAGLYGCWRLSGLIENYLGSINSFLSAAGYLYVVVAIAWAYRIFFGYTKWAFPTVELIDGKDSAKKHRAFWYLIATGILAQFLWEAFR